MVREAKSLYGLNYTIIRPSALYGIRCVSGRVSQKFIENALEGKTLRLEGGGDGMLDFTHIDDLVEGITRATSFKNGIDRTFNITFGNARKIIDIANIIKDVIPNVKFEITPAQPEKPKRGTLSVQKSKDLLGFYPKKHIDDAYKDYCIWDKINNGRNLKRISNDQTKFNLSKRPLFRKNSKKKILPVF